MLRHGQRVLGDGTLCEGSLLDGVPDVPGNLHGNIALEVIVTVHCVQAHHAGTALGVKLLASSGVWRYREDSTAELVGRDPSALRGKKSIQTIKSTWDIKCWI